MSLNRDDATVKTINIEVIKKLLDLDGSEVHIGYVVEFEIGEGAEELLELCQEVTIGTEVMFFGLELERDHLVDHSLDLAPSELDLVFLTQSSDNGAEPSFEIEVWFVKVGLADGILAFGAIAVLNVE